MDPEEEYMINVTEDITLQICQLHVNVETIVVQLISNIDPKYAPSGRTLRIMNNALSRIRDSNFSLGRAIEQLKLLENHE